MLTYLSREHERANVRPTPSRRDDPRGRFARRLLALRRIYFFKFIEVSKEGNIDKNNEEVFYIIKSTECSYKEGIFIDNPGYKPVKSKKN